MSNATLLASSIAFKSALPYAFELSMIRDLQAITLNVNSLLFLLARSAYPSIYVRQRKGLEGLKQTVKPFQNFIKGC